MFFHLFWALLFCVNQIAITLVAHLILSYLKQKPLGHQTLFDLLVSDLLWTIIVATNVFTAVIILSRLNAAFPHIFLPQNFNLTRICCLIYYFFYILSCVNTTLTSAVRIVSVVWVGFLVIIRNFTDMFILCYNLNF